VRNRLEGGPVAPLKLASGCDRRCSFCAIPSFRGAFVSRRPAELLAEAAWLAESGVRELVLVSENSTSYGKDLGELRLLELLLPRFAEVAGIERIRVNYLQPAEMRPTLIDALTGTDKVVPYFDLSFQHSSADVLRRMRRFGDTDRFLGLIAQIRERAPEAGIRTNVIVGFPGETEADVGELERFLVGARLDTVGVFGYSDEDGTEAATFDDKVDADEVRERVERITRLVEELTNARAEDRIGETVHVLVEENDPFRYPGADTHGEASGEGRAAHQAPEVDGSTILIGGAPVVGEFVTATVVGADGVDLIATMH
jgi:ribosomal protein S12 methylthiotransferase